MLLLWLTLELELQELKGLCACIKDNDGSVVVVWLLLLLPLCIVFVSEACLIQKKEGRIIFVMPSFQWP